MVPVTYNSNQNTITKKKKKKALGVYANKFRDAMQMRTASLRCSFMLPPFVEKPQNQEIYRSRSIYPRFIEGFYGR